MFEKDTHKVNLGSSFLSEKSAREMTLYLSNSLLQVPHVNVLLLQQRDNTNAAGLHVVLQNSIESIKFTFDRKNRGG